MNTAINKEILQFQPISLDEMNEVALMKRRDTKFVVHTSVLPELLQDIQSDYRVLEVADDRIMTYKTSYFDTPDFSFYKNHHNQRSNRVKIRIREYTESKISFLEIKKKDNKGMTHKSRIPTSHEKTEIDQTGNKLIKDVTGRSFELNKTLENQFNRFTLVGNQISERVTFDLNLAYNEEPFAPNLAIIELKQIKLNRQSPIFKSLKKRSYNPFSISKYCIGLIHIQPTLKSNLFKSKIRTIERLQIR